MPTILRFRGFNIMIFTDDHEPAHVHAVGHDGFGIFRLHCPTGPVIGVDRKHLKRSDERALEGFLNDNLTILAKGGKRSMISEQEWVAAENRAKEIQDSGMYATSAHYDPENRMMHVTLKHGFTLSFLKERSQVMANASNEDLSEIEIAGTGNYIIFPKLDDGFTIEGMLAGRFGNRYWEEMWAQKQGISNSRLTPSSSRPSPQPGPQTPDRIGPSS